MQENEDLGWKDAGEISEDEEIRLKDAGVQVDLESGNANSIFSTMRSCDKKLFSATGIHSVQLLNSLTSNFGKIAPDSNLKSFAMSICDRIILTMMKIKLAISFSALAAILDVTIQTCCNYFYDSFVVVAKILKCMVVWPGEEAVMKNLPKCFSKYRSTRAILDAYEAVSYTHLTLPTKRIV